MATSDSSPDYGPDSTISSDDSPDHATGPDANAREGTSPGTNRPPRVLETLIGRYRLMHELGRGGFGIVWKAEQTDPIRREVALKIVKPGMDTEEIVARFEAERQALALMEHPNIASVLDAGTTEDGRPYFVMELVKGVSITEHCDTRKMSVRERLELFIPVCLAVQHAHQKAILHRDLKPSNILVTEVDGKPIPKVIDFGIAKALGADDPLQHGMTQAGVIIGTPQYMSPEQAGAVADIDTRSDIYTLGAILYELLTGAPPLPQELCRKAALGEILRMIRETEPVRPSNRFSPDSAAVRKTAASRRLEPRRLTKTLKGELDWIVLKALEKERSLRYSSAADLGQDIARHLQNEPVEAGPPGGMYRLQKMIRRHRVSVTVAAIITALLILGITLTTWQARRALVAERTSATEAKRAFLAGQASAAETRRALAAESESRVQAQRALSAEAKTASESEQRRLLLTEASRSDRVAAEASLAIHDVPAAFAHLIRAMHYDPANHEAQEKAVAALNDWRTPLPHVVFRGHRKPISTARFSPDGTAIVTASWDRTSQIFDTGTGGLKGAMYGHSGIVYDARFSADGTRILTASGDGTARIWDTASRKELMRFAPSHYLPTLADFSPDNSKVVTVAEIARTAHIWDTATGQALAKFENHANPIRTAQFSPDSNTVLTVSSEGAKLWDVASGKERAFFEDAMSSAAFSPDGRHIVTASSNNLAKVWNVATKTTILTLTGHSEPVKQALFSPQGDSIATISADESARVWEFPSGKERKVCLGHTNEVTHVRFSPDGKLLLTASLDGTARLWDLSDRRSSHSKMLNIYWGHSDTINNIEFSPSGDQVLTVSADETVRIWKTRSKSHMLALAAKGALIGASFSPDGQSILVSGERAQIWDLASNKQRGELQDHQRYIQSASFTHDGHWILTIGDATARVWNANDFTSFAEFPIATDRHSPLTDITPDGRTFATVIGIEHMTLQIYDVQSSRILSEISSPARQFVAIALSPDGNYIVTSSLESFARVWDVRTGRELWKSSDHGNGISRLGFSPDGRRLFTAGHDQKIRIWDFPTKFLWSQLSFGDGKTTKYLAFAEFNADGSRLATGTRERTAQIWNTDTGKLSASLKGHTNDIFNARFSLDGRLLATGSLDTTARVWDVDSGRLIATLRGHGNPVTDVNFSHDGKKVVTGSSDRSVRVWPILNPDAKDEPTPEWFGDFLHYMGRKRLNGNGELEWIPLDEWCPLQQRLLEVSGRHQGQDSQYLKLLRFYLIP